MSYPINVIEDIRERIKAAEEFDAAKIAKEVKKKYGLEQSPKAIKKQVLDQKAILDKVMDRAKSPVVDYQLDPVEQDLILRYRRIQKEGEQEGLDPQDIKHGWIKSDSASLFFKNPGFKEVNFDRISDVFEKLALKYTSGKLEKIKPRKLTDKKAIKITTSDDHVGLNPNPDGDALFRYEYSAEIYKKSIDHVFGSILKEHAVHGHFDLLLLDNLGDEEDGWDGHTVRGGHDLDQNMTNEEVFETVVDTKVKLVQNIVEANIANRIILRKVVNSNHSSSFGHIINLAVQKIINLKYDSKLVQVEHLSRFMEHRVYGDHCFILTHGKDKKKMIKGLPLNLNPPTINFVNEYIDHYGIDSKYIHVEKGDLHQIGYHRCNKFDYRNFPSFAPPSSWVQHNYGDSYSGYSIQVIPKHSNEISHTDYFLDYTKKR